MNRVYIVYGDNGESYEDGIDWIEAVFTSHEFAVEYIENELGCIKSDYKWKDTWHAPKFVCSMNNIDCEDCPKFDPDDDYSCEEYEERLESSRDNTYYYIKNYEVSK